MLVSVHRLAAVGTCVLLLLALVVTTSTPAHAASPFGTISGTVLNPEGNPQSNVRVTLFQKQDDGTWRFYDEAGTLSGTTQNPEQAGTYTILAPSGIYRVGFGLGLGDYAVDSGGVYKGQYYSDAGSPDAAQAVEVTDGSAITNIDATMQYSGGTVSGTVLDVAGQPLKFAEVQGYNTDGAHDEDTASYDPNFDTTTDESGHFTLRTRGEPFKLYVLQDSHGYVPEWYDDSTSYAGADTLNVATGEAVTLDPITLDSLPLVNEVAPEVHGDLYVGGTARADVGEWSSHSATYTYQWYRIFSSGRELKLTSAVHSTYTLNSHNYGHRLRVVVTASQAGVPDVAARSGKSATVKLGSKISFATSSTSRGQVKVHATVWKSTGSHASGKIRFTCGNSYVTYAGRTLTLKSGYAATTLKYVPSGTKTCTAKYYGTSTVAGRTKTDTVKVR